MSTVVPQHRRKTRDELIAAALLEFQERGYRGTDTNKIARRAGFSPQTFYRWFKDKTDIFIAVYRAWEEEERWMAANLARSGADLGALLDATVKHHRDHRYFRRSLRTLSLEDPQVRRARAESRGRQIDRILRAAERELAREFVAVRLLELERLADALAEGELTDMDLNPEAALQRLAEISAELQ